MRPAEDPPRAPTLAVILAVRSHWPLAADHVAMQGVLTDSVEQFDFAIAQHEALFTSGQLIVNRNLVPMASHHRYNEMT